MTNNQLIELDMKLQNNTINKQAELINDNKEFREFDMKLQNNMINKQAELIHDNKEFREKLSIIDFKCDEL